MSFTFNLSQSWFVYAPTSTNPYHTPIGVQNSSIVVNVYPQWYKQVSLEWTVPSNWAGSSYHVYYWPGGDEDFIRLTSNPTTDQFFLDTTNIEYSKTEEGYYIVEATVPPTNQVVKSLPASWNYKRRDKLERIANEIQRREYLLLSKFSGAKSFLFRRKTYGPRCPRCWDPNTEKIMDDNCPVCYGTSFDGGYYNPIPIFAQYDPTVANKQKAFQGVIEPNAIQAWTISMPEINSDDVIIRTSGWNVYRVISSNPTELQTKTVRQVLSITQLSRSDVENKLTLLVQSPTSSNYLSTFDTPFAAKRFPQNVVDTNPNNDPQWEKDQNLPNLPIYTI